MIQHFDPLQRVLHAVAQALDSFQRVLVHRLAAPAAGGAGGLEFLHRAQQRIVFVNLKHPVQLGQILFDGRGIVDRTTRQRRRLRRADPRLADRALRAARQLVHPRGGQVHRLAGVGQPPFRVRPLLQRAAQRLRQRPHLLRPATVVQRRQRVAFFGIGLLQHLVQRVVHQPPLHRVVQNPEGRIHARRFKMRAQKVGAEGVQRGDAGALQPDHLLAAAVVALRRQRRQPSAELGAHVRRRRAGERHHQHPIHVRAVVQDQPQHALHQHRRLARSRRRAQQQVGSARFDRPRLFLRPLHHLSS